MLTIFTYKPLAIYKMPGFFSLFFWRLYKWLLRFLTRKCELLRICEGTMDLTSRTIAVGEKRERNGWNHHLLPLYLSLSLYITANSLKSSRHKVSSTVTLTNFNISLPLLYMYMYIYYFLSLSLLPVKGASWYSSHYST